MYFQFIKKLFYLNFFTTITSNALLLYQVQNILTLFENYLPKHQGSMRFSDSDRLPIQLCLKKLTWPALRCLHITYITSAWFQICHCAALTFPKTAFHLPVPNFGTFCQTPEAATLITRRSLRKKGISQPFATMF